LPFMARNGVIPGSGGKRQILIRNQTIFKEGLL